MDEVGAQPRRTCSFAPRSPIRSLHPRSTATITRPNFFGVRKQRSTRESRYRYLNNDYTQSLANPARADSFAVRRRSGSLGPSGCWDASRLAALALSVRGQTWTLDRQVCPQPATAFGRPWCVIDPLGHGRQVQRLVIPQLQARRTAGRVTCSTGGRRAGVAICGACQR